MEKKRDNQLENHETPYCGMVLNGFLMLFVTLLLIPGIIAAWLIATEGDPGAAGWVICALLFVAMLTFMGGFISQQPNQARVMIFFGKYKGTFKATGYYWVNPFMTTKKISLRIRNMDVPPIKVNDKVGNPVMIGMVLVWKVSDTYRATFDIDNDDVPAAGTVKIAESGSSRHSTSALENFVSIQSDAALREVTGRFAYDNEGTSHDEITLRGGGDEINELLEEKLNERLTMAGIEVVEARLNYLAYAPEIAAVMLRRQQASAIIAAREKIVEGAVSMVKMALTELKEENVVELDEERKAAMVSNLLVVLCADDPAQPVVNTGTLYN